MRFLVLLLVPLVSFSQDLLLNGGFEEENICSEYSVNCAPEAWIYTVPSFTYYFKDLELAHSGEHFIALIAGHAKKPYYRSFVRSRLLCGLRKGQTYQLRFYIKSAYPVLDSIGVYFSDYDFLFEKQPYYKVVPSVYLKNAQQKPLQTTNWQQVTINYVARGDEAFISLGNFKKGDITGLTRIDRENIFFVFLDDISLRPIDPKEVLCSDWQLRRDQIYGENARHEYLQRLMRLNKSKPKEKVPTSYTRFLRIDTLIIPDVLFNVNSYTLSNAAYSILDSFVRKTKGLLIDSVIIEGHTDSTGKATANRMLSANRSKAVYDFIMPYFKEPIITRAWGSAKPVADNKTPWGRQKNRRVEIYLYVKQ